MCIRSSQKSNTLQMKRRSKQQQQSGMSAAQFCRSEKINQKYFSSRKIQLLKESKATSAFTKVKVSQVAIQNNIFELQHSNSTLKFNQYPDPQWLSQLMSSLL